MNIFKSLLYKILPVVLLATVFVSSTHAAVAVDSYTYEYAGGSSITFNFNGKVFANGDTISQADIWSISAIVADPVLCADASVPGLCDINIFMWNFQFEAIVADDAPPLTNTDFSIFAMAAIADPLLTSIGNMAADVASFRTLNGNVTTPDIYVPDNCDGGCIGTWSYTVVDDCVGQPLYSECANPVDDGPYAYINTTGICNENETCSGLFCDGVTCTGDDTGNQCTADACSFATGACGPMNMPAGTPCDDGDVSTTNDNCLAGVCAGVPDYCLGVSCPDTGNQCTVSACDSLNGLCGVENELEGTICDDGDGATTNDMCQLGVCAGSVAEEPTGCAYNSHGGYDMLLMILLACGIFYGRNARFARR